MMSKNPTYTVLIIDEEQSSRRELCELLEIQAPEFRVDAVCAGIEEAEAARAQCQPALVFLSVDTHAQPWPDLLRPLLPIDFEVICTGSSRAHVYEALRSGALDFLLKPVDKVELASVLARFRRYWQAGRPKVASPAVLPRQPLLSEIRSPARKIVVATHESLLFLDILDIVCIRAMNNYSTISLKNGKKVTASKTLRYFENRLPPLLFFRVHSSCLVNVEEIAEYKKKEQGNLVLSNGDWVQVSRQRKLALVKWMEELEE